MAYGKTVSDQAARVWDPQCLLKQLFHWHCTSKLLFISHYLPCLQRCFVNKLYNTPVSNSSPQHYELPNSGTSPSHWTRPSTFQPAPNTQGGDWTSTPLCPWLWSTDSKSITWWLPQLLWGLLDSSSKPQGTSKAGIGCHSSCQSKGPEHSTFVSWDE